MPVVTLTSDLGIKDYYVAIIKGKILSQAENTNIVDISHEIAPFNIQEAAFLLKNSFSHFPEGTIHMVSVHAEKREATKCLLILYKNHYFVGIDNGLFALIFDENPQKIIEIQNKHNITSSFVAKDLLCDVIGEILTGKAIDTLGNVINSIESKTYLNPPDNAYLMRVNIVYIDRFGNLVLNITKEKFESNRAGRNFVINYKRTEELREISDTYGDVPEGERLCLFNASGYLEIAINKGNANQLLGLHLDNTIQIEFE